MKCNFFLIGDSVLFFPYVLFCCKCVLSIVAHLVDTQDCLFDRGWVCRWEPSQDTLLDSLQDITGERENIRNHSLANTEGHRHAHTHTHTHTHTGSAVFGLEQDVHRWRSLKKMSAPITWSAECVLHTDEPHLPIRCGRR